MGCAHSVWSGSWTEGGRGRRRRSGCLGDGQVVVSRPFASWCRGDCCAAGAGVSLGHRSNRSHRRWRYRRAMGGAARAPPRCRPSRLRCEQEGGRGVAADLRSLTRSTTDVGSCCTVTSSFGHRCVLSGGGTGFWWRTCCASPSADSRCSPGIGYERCVPGRIRCRSGRAWATVYLRGLRCSGLAVGALRITNTNRSTPRCPKRSLVRARRLDQHACSPSSMTKKGGESRPRRTVRTRPYLANAKNFAS